MVASHFVKAEIEPSVFKAIILLIINKSIFLFSGYLNRQTTFVTSEESRGRLVSEVVPSVQTLPSQGSRFFDPEIEYENVPFLKLFIGSHEFVQG